MKAVTLPTAGALALAPVLAPEERLVQRVPMLAPLPMEATRLVYVGPRHALIRLQKMVGSESSPA